MLGGWGEIVGSVVTLIALVGLVTGNRATVLWTSPRPFTPARVGFVVIAGAIRVGCLVALAVAMILLPPT